jgi:hypothetical protein
VEFFGLALSLLPPSDREEGFRGTACLRTATLSISAPGQGSHQRGAPLPSFPVLHQLHISHPQERWWHEAHPQPKEVERCSSGHSTLPDGDSRGRLPRTLAGRLGNVHRPLGRLLPRPFAPFHKEVHEVWVEGQALPVPGPSIWSIPSPQSLHVPNSSSQGEFRVQAPRRGGMAVGHSLPPPPPPPPFLFRAYGGKGDPWIFHYRLCFPEAASHPGEDIDFSVLVTLVGIEAPLVRLHYFRALMI